MPCHHDYNYQDILKNFNCISVVFFQHALSSHHFLSPRNDPLQNNVWSFQNPALASSQTPAGPFGDPTAGQRASIFDMFAQAASGHSYSSPGHLSGGFKGHEGHQMFYSGAMNALRYHPAAGLALAASKKKGENKL